MSVWRLAWRRFRQSGVNCFAVGVVAAFSLFAALSAAGGLTHDWQAKIGVPHAPPTMVGPRVAAPHYSETAQDTPTVLDISAHDPLQPHYTAWEQRASALQTTTQTLALTLPWGGDGLGRDVRKKALKGAQVSIGVGVFAALLATLIGTLAGAVAGFMGGWVDDLLEWFYNVFTAIPGILLIFTFAALLNHSASPIPKGVFSLVLILGLIGWPGIYRLVRSEFIKHLGRDYVRAAQALGAGSWRRMFVHILPNVSHIVLVQLSVHVVGFIKAEVILSYLGLGVGVDEVSWGSMLAESQSELLLGQWWQLAAATSLMALFVTAFSTMTDGLRDALDPKLQ